MPSFSSTHEGHTQMPLGCAVHHLACTAEPGGYTRMGHVFRFACMGWWNIVQVNMLHWCNIFKSPMLLVID